MRNVNANELVNLLLVRHSSDLCIPECATGPHGSRRMDLWVFPRSWSNPETHGYEVKVSRSDFLNDTKWPEYLEFCNNFSFVCPWGLIDVSEVPEGCGLIYATKNVERLYTKIKAPRREVTDLESVLRYVLMSRAKIVPAGYFGPGDQTIGREEVERFLASEKELNTDVGRRFSRAIAKAVKARVGQIESENARVDAKNRSLRAEIDQYKSFQRAMERHKISRWTFEDGEGLLQRIRDHFDISPRDLNALKGARDAIERVLNTAEGTE